MKLWITGASRGLGLAMVEEALARGHEVAAGVRMATNELTEMEKASGGRLLLLQMDVMDAEAVSRAAGQIEERFGALDAVVNNAAVLLGREDFLETVNIEEIRTCMEVNVYGALRVTQAALPLIRKGENRAVMNISSESGAFFRTRLDDYPYCISKAALNMASEKMRKYLGKEGIRVITVHPGWMHTDMGGKEAPLAPIETARPLLDMLEGTLSYDTSCLMVDRLGEKMPIDVEEE